MNLESSSTIFFSPISPRPWQCKILGESKFFLKRNMMFWCDLSFRQGPLPAAYDLQIYNRKVVGNDNLRNLWQRLWKSGLHNRHKILVWHAISKAIPTGDHLKVWLRRGEHCLIYGHETESIAHLLLRYPLMKVIWFNSCWQFCLYPFLGWETVEWFGELLNPLNIFLWTMSKIKRCLNLL